MTPNEETVSAVEDFLQDISNQHMQNVLQELGLNTEGSKFRKADRLQQWLLGNYTATDFVEESEDGDAIQSRIERRERWIDRTLGETGTSPEADNSSERNALVALTADAAVTTAIANLMYPVQTPTDPADIQIPHTDENQQRSEDPSIKKKVDGVELEASKEETFKIPKELSTTLAEILLQLRRLSQTTEPVSSTRLENAEHRRQVGFQDTFTCHYDDLPTKIDLPSSSPREQISAPSTSKQQQSQESSRHLPRRSEQEGDFSNTAANSWQSSRFTPSPRDIGSIVRKWQIRFSGDKNQSVEVFLTRVEDYRTAANLSDEQMLSALAELLTDTAATWHQNEKHKWQSWNDFVRAATRWFGTSQRFQQRLIAEANARTQASDENVRQYMTCLIGIMRKQRPIPPMSAQIDLLHRNLLPRLQKQVRRADCTSVEVMLDLAVEAEQIEEYERTYRPPPEPESTLLPEMAYRKRPSQEEKPKAPKASAAAIAPDQTAREADILLKISRVLENILKQNKSSSAPQTNPSKKDEKRGTGKKPGKDVMKKDDPHRSPKGKRKFDPSKPLKCDGCGRLGFMKRYCPDCSENEQKGG